MAQLTWQSLFRALTQLKPRERGQLARAGVQITMCVYDAEEAKQFESEWNVGTVDAGVQSNQIQSTN